MEHDEYRDYLGITHFTGYVTIPERFGCNDPEGLKKSIKNQLERIKEDELRTGEETRVFLYGIGICKMAVASEFKKMYPAIYIDIGILMAGLAGFLSQSRPYSAGWTNYRIKGYDYSKLDQMDTQNEKNIKWLN